MLTRGVLRRSFPASVLRVYRCPIHSSVGRCASPCFWRPPLCRRGAGTDGGGGTAHRDGGKRPVAERVRPRARLMWPLTARSAPRPPRPCWKRRAASPSSPGRRWTTARRRMWWMRSPIRPAWSPACMAMIRASTTSISAASPSPRVAITGMVFHRRPAISPTGAPRPMALSASTSSRAGGGALWPDRAGRPHQPHLQAAHGHRLRRGGGAGGRPRLVSGRVRHRRASHQDGNVSSTASPASPGRRIGAITSTSNDALYLARR